MWPSAKGDAGASGAARRSFALGRSEQALVDQTVEADEQRIAGERGEALIRRVAVAGGPERQHLPELLAGRGEEVEELDRARPQIADAEAAGQRGRVEQHAAAREKDMSRIARLASAVAYERARGQRCGAASVSRRLLCSELLFEQLPGGIAPAEAERNRQPQHQRAERDRKRRQHDGGRQPQLLERHHDRNGNHEQPQRRRSAGGRPGMPAFTDASSVARQTKLPTRNPSASTSSATRKRGTKRKNSCTSP